MKCPTCQHENRETAKFCDNCGTGFPIACPNCSRSNRPGAKFCDNCGYKLGQVEEKSVETSSSQAMLSKFIPQELAAKLETARASQSMPGERRIVTILFCDVKGSTAAAEKLDPEEWTEIMNGAFEYMIRPVYQYEGTVARLMGDAILAFFGAPIAHEDDPQRAILAGMGIISSTQPYREQIKRDWGIDFDVRVGINTGLVVVGAVGSDLRMEYTAMGDAINLAARMEQTALPGTVQVTEETYKLVAPMFDFEPLGDLRVKGKAATVKTYRPLKRKTVPGRLRGIAGVETPLVGRINERRILESAIEQLGNGIGGIIFLIGEAGLGKSRLLQEIRHSNEGQANYQWFGTHSLSYETEQPYGLIQRLMRQVIGISSEDGPESMYAKIHQVVEEFPANEKTRARRVLKSLFGLSSTAEEPPLQGETFKGLLYMLMTTWWRHRAKVSPVVLVCDDVQWSDQASLRLIEHLYPLTNQTAFLLVFAMRPDRDTPSSRARQVAAKDYPHGYTEIKLQSLSAAESGELVDSLLAISDLPADLRARIMKKSEGNPYFIEEVVRTLIDEGLVTLDDTGARWQAARYDSDFDIPGNLKTLLVARLDRLEDESRRILQVASVIGRSFYYRILQNLVEIEDQELNDHIETLKNTQLIQKSAQLPELEYQFRHTLTQEAAYSTILLKHRRIYHRKIGEVLETSFPDQRKELAGTIADHFFQAGAFDKALFYYTQSGNTAYRLHAVTEAIAHYKQALVCAAKIAVENQQLIHLYVQLGRAFELAGRFDEAMDNYREMKSIAAERKWDDLQLASLSAQCILRATQTPFYDPQLARSLGEEALALATKLGNQATEAKVLWGMLLVEAWGDGDYQKALKYGMRSLKLARKLNLTEQLGYTYTNMVNVHWNLNQLEAAREANRAAQAKWEESGNLPMLADAYTMKQFALSLAGRWEEMQALAEKSLQFSESIGNTWNQLIAMLYSSQAALEQGNINLALAYIRQLSKLRDETGFQAQGVLFADLQQNLMISLVSGVLKEAESLADKLFEKQRDLLTIFRVPYFGNILQAKVTSGRIQEAQEIFEEFEAEIDLARIPIIYKGSVVVAAIDLLLAKEDYEDVIEQARDFAETIKRINFRQFLPDVLLLQARAHISLDQYDDAAWVLEEALQASEDSGERRLRWKILAILAELEAYNDNISKADSLQTQAREIIDFIAKHTGRDDMRNSFLAIPQVQSIVSLTGGKHV